MPSVVTAGDHAGICADCGRVLSEPQETFFGTMCHTCKNALIASAGYDKEVGT